MFVHIYTHIYSCMCVYVYMRMDLCSNDEKRSKSLEDFNKALELEPKMLHAYRAKINTLRSIGRHEDVRDKK